MDAGRKYDRREHSNVLVNIIRELEAIWGVEEIGEISFVFNVLRKRIKNVEAYLQPMKIPVVHQY